MLVFCIIEFSLVYQQTRSGRKGVKVKTSKSDSQPEWSLVGPVLLLGVLPCLSSQSKWSVSLSFDQLQSVFSSKRQFPAKKKKRDRKLQIKRVFDFPSWLFMATDCSRLPPYVHRSAWIWRCIIHNLSHLSASLLQSPWISSSQRQNG